MTQTKNPRTQVWVMTNDVNDAQIYGMMLSQSQLLKVLASFFSENESLGSASKTKSLGSDSKARHH